MSILWSPLAVASTGRHVPVVSVEDVVPVVVEELIVRFVAILTTPYPVEDAGGIMTCALSPSMAVAIAVTVELLVEVAMLWTVLTLAVKVIPVTGLPPPEMPLPADTLGVLATMFVPVPVPVTDHAGTCPLLPAPRVG